MKISCRLHAYKNSLERLWGKKLVEYHDLYLKGDTLLLADVFESVRKNVFKNLSFRSCKISFTS